jgi:hypothetical protein
MEPKSRRTQQMLKQEEEQNNPDRGARDADDAPG